MIAKLLAVACLIGSAPAAPPAQPPAAPSSRRIHERVGKIQIPGPAARTFLFFTPEGERAWAGEDWNPQTVCSKSGRDEAGMLFTNGAHPSLWLVTRLDAASRVVEYVIVSNDVLTVLHIEVSPAGDEASVATVAYEWIPRTDGGEQKASEHDRHFMPMLESWGDAMRDVLAGKTAPANHRGTP
jgi:hypothetical protein